MKKSAIFFLLSLGFVACENADRPLSSFQDDRINEKTIGSFKKVLIGNWVRVNNDAEEKTFEYWIATENELSGIGFTMVGNDTVFKEILEILEIKGHLYYEVRGVNPEPTLFKFIEESETHFICVNDTNEFPNRIEYQFYEDSMTAMISAGDQKVMFQFTRME